MNLDRVFVLWRSILLLQPGGFRSLKYICLWCTVFSVIESLESLDLVYACFFDNIFGSYLGILCYYSALGFVLRLYWSIPLESFDSCTFVLSCFLSWHLTGVKRVGKWSAAGMLPMAVFLRHLAITGRVASYCAGIYSSDHVYAVCISKTKICWLLSMCCIISVRYRSLWRAI